MEKDGDGSGDGDEPDLHAECRGEGTARPPRYTGKSRRIHAEARSFRSGPVNEITDLIDSVIKKRFSCLRSNASGNRNRGWTLYDDISMMALDMGGPDAYREIGGRYVIGFSCRAHSCSEKGLTIFDKAHNDFIFSIIHYFPWELPENGSDNWVKNGIISAFVRPGYPETNLGALAAIVHEWAKQEHRGSRGEIVDIPPIRFYAVDCSAGPDSAGRQ